MLIYRKANIEDKILYFDWANDDAVREQSYNSSTIDFDTHCKWFESELVNISSLMLVFQNEENLNIGQVRIEKVNIKEALIGISIGIQHRGKSYAKEMLQNASDYFLDLNKGYRINAYIKMKNVISKYAFEKAGFEFEADLIYKNIKSLHYIKQLK